MTESFEEEDDNGRTSIYVYNGVDSVPSTAIQVRVEPSITEIPFEAFFWHSAQSHLTTVELPEGLEKIGSHAFAHCSNLEMINIPSTVRVMEKAVFHSCFKLQEIFLPDGLLILGEMAFYYCRSLQTINIPPLIETIEVLSFAECTSLTQVILPTNLHEIKEHAFEKCKTLVSIDFPSSLRVIGNMAFQGTGLTALHLPDSLEHCGSFGEYKFPNLRIPPLITKFDTSIFGDTGQYNNLISIELSVNVKHVIYSDSVIARLPKLRSIAFPKGCSVDIGDNIEDIEKSYLRNFLFQKLLHRFDSLPLHELCYYHSYHNTDKVLSDMRRVIHPWATKTRCGKLSDVGKRQDYWSMTPLHILACTTKHHLELYQLLVEKYPETLVTKDHYGDTPLFYAFFCNAPIEVIEFLVESYVSKYPDFEFDWEHMTTYLARHFGHHQRIQMLVGTHRRYFPNQKLDLKNVVMKIASAPRDVSITTFRFLFSASIATRVNTLNVRRWSSNLCESIREVPGDELLPVYTMWVYNKLDAYESYKEATTLLELALWKMALAEHFVKKSRTCHQHSYQIQCRIHCGAGIVIQNVLPFLWHSSDFPGRTF
jgi:hypothetical protein